MRHRVTWGSAVVLAVGVLVLPTLADDWMKAFLDTHADALADWGERQGL